MNNSGKSVATVCNFFKLAPENLLVAYDEIDLMLASLVSRTGVVMEDITACVIS